MQVTDQTTLRHLDPSTFDATRGELVPLKNGDSVRVYTRDELDEIASLVEEAFPVRKFALDPFDQPGPRQVGALRKAIDAMMRREGFTVDVKGTVGSPCVVYDSATMICFSRQRVLYPAVHEARHLLGERFGWTLSRKNAKEVTAAALAFVAALRAGSYWLVDTRITPEDVEAREAASALAQVRSVECQAAREVDSLVGAAIDAKRPADATALIVAELHQNDSDLMTDYHAHKTVRTVAIGWRTGSRESFAQLRRAAAGFEETRHLGPGLDTWRLCVNESGDWEKDRGIHGHRQLRDETFGTEADATARAEVLISEGSTHWGELAKEYGYRAYCASSEHRENYSMGAGNYLKSGGCDSDGWCVKSVGLGSVPTNIEDGIQEAPSVEAGTAAYTVEEATNKKGGFWLCVPSARLERHEFDAERDRAKACGGWYSRKWGRQAGGFGFNSEEAALAFGK